MNKKLRLLVVEDHEILRAGICSLLKQEEDLDIVDAVPDGKQACETAGKLSLDLILMDLSMPNTNGTEAIETIKSRRPDIKIIALTIHNNEEHIRAAFRAGANGYVLKDDSCDELLIAIKSVAQGKTYISPNISDRVVAGFLDPSKNELDNGKSSWDMLTLREREVIKLIAQGMKNKDIAQYLSLSPKTIEKHRSNLIRKLNVSGTSALIAYAFENGLVDSNNVSARLQ